MNILNPYDNFLFLKIQKQSIWRKLAFSKVKFNKSPSI